MVSGSLILPVACNYMPPKSTSNSVFVHGVASGDPDHTSVIIWTRISQSTVPVTVGWTMATDVAFTQIVATGSFITNSHRDYTVKVEVSKLQPGMEYFYKFEANGNSSPTGRTKTLTKEHLEHVVLAVVTCSNYSFGYFNVYDAIAKDPTIDVVVHLGDYIYEHGVDGYGGGTGKRIGRNHLPSHEIITLNDYRSRHAQYKKDQDSLAMHARHPLIVIWDDHETANNPWMGGAGNHSADEGSWEDRRNASLQAYYEWLPIRDPLKIEDRKNYWRHYKFGDLMSLITLESRHTGRSKQISYNQYLPALKNSKQVQNFLSKIVGDPDRSMLSKEMEKFLSVSLEESKQSGQRWRIIGSPSVIAKSISPKLENTFFHDLKDKLAIKEKNKLEQLSQLGQLELPADLDGWDGYPAARERFYQIATKAGVNDMLVISGDSHSYWANALFDAEQKSMGVELGSTGISSPRSIMKLGEEAMNRYDKLNQQKNKEIVWSDGSHRGFIRLYVDHNGAHADFINVSTVESRDYQSQIIHRLDIESNKGHLEFK